MKNQKNLEDILNDLNSYLNEEEKGWLRDYMDAGEEWLAFELIAAFVLNKKVPLTKELYDWIQQTGFEFEGVSNELNPDWKKIKLI